MKVKTPFFSLLLLFGFLSMNGVMASASSADNQEQQCSNEEDGTCTPPVDNDSAASNSNQETELVFAPLGKPTEYTASSTGIRLAVRRWIPNSKGKSPKAVAIFNHGGAGWHSGYSQILGDYLVSQNIALIAFDYVGAGHSDGIVYQDQQLKHYFDSLDTLANDFTKILTDTRKEFPTQKVFAIGESFGCLILLKQIMMEQNASGSDSNNGGRLADGYILTGPVVKLLPEMLPPSFIITIFKFLSNFFPMLTMPGTDFFSTFDLAFGDKRWAKAGRADPIIQEAAVTPPKLGMISSVLGFFEYLNSNLDQVKVPFHIFMGEFEGRVDTVAVKQLEKESESKDKGITIVPGAYHQLFQDMPNVTLGVCEGIKDWIMARA